MTSIAPASPPIFQPAPTPQPAAVEQPAPPPPPIPNEDAAVRSSKPIPDGLDQATYSRPAPAAAAAQELKGAPAPAVADAIKVAEA